MDKNEQQLKKTNEMDLTQWQLTIVSIKKYILLGDSVNFLIWAVYKIDP